MENFSCSNVSKKGGLLCIDTFSFLLWHSWTQPLHTVVTFTERVDENSTIQFESHLVPALCGFALRGFPLMQLLGEFRVS